MVFFKELYTTKSWLKHKGGETSCIFYTISSGMIVIIVCITNSSKIVVVASLFVAYCS